MVFRLDSCTAPVGTRDTGYWRFQSDSDDFLIWSEGFLAAMLLCNSPKTLSMLVALVWKEADVSGILP